MKKIFFLLLSCIFFNSAVYAETIVVQAMNDISTLNPPKTCTIKILSDIQLDENFILKCGDVVMGHIINVTDPKMLKRNAKFSIQLFAILKENKIESIENTNYIGKYTTKLNKTEAAKTAALGVGNFFVKGLSMGYRAVEGAIKNEEGNRIESSAVALYQNSPFSYVETGEEVNIKNGDLFYLKFKKYKEKDSDDDEEEED